MMSDHLRNWIDPKIEVRESPIHGKGMFATDKFDKGEVLMIWRESYTDRAGAMKAIAEGKGTMQWDDDVFSCETELHPDDYKINHSCDPNSGIADAHTVVAMREISKDEEITVDFAMFEDDEKALLDQKCNCGSPMCRGTITGKDWMIEELQERYKGYFSPLISKRIKIRQKNRSLTNIKL